MEANSIRHNALSKPKLDFAPDALPEVFGQIDIYLFDQILKGRISPSMRVLDAGCGAGRNLIYLGRMGCKLSAVDSDSSNLCAALHAVAKNRGDVDPDRFRVAHIESLPFEDASFDVVICSAVLHFASNDNQFDRMVRELWRVLAPGGLLFTRLASLIGIESRVRPIGNGRYLLPDGTERFLVDAAKLESTTGRLGASLADPIKTTQVHEQRSMTTWCLRKDALRDRGLT
jgi:SAM-dependent methyltransferase